jgi:hypothetical protein
MTLSELESKIVSRQYYGIDGIKRAHVNNSLKGRPKGHKNYTTIENQCIVCKKIFNEFEVTIIGSGPKAETVCNEHYEMIDVTNRLFYIYRGS